MGGPELIIILVIILVLFGAKKLPGLARGMGQSIQEFRKAKDESSDDGDHVADVNAPENGRAADRDRPKLRLSAPAPGGGGKSTV